MSSLSSSFSNSFSKYYPYSEENKTKKRMNECIAKMQQYYDMQSGSYNINKDKSNDIQKFIDTTCNDLNNIDKKYQDTTEYKTIEELKEKINELKDERPAQEKRYEEEIQRIRDNPPPDLNLPSAARSRWMDMGGGKKKGKTHRKQNRKSIKGKSRKNTRKSNRRR
jgi:hypothetical protein